jgi:hypothetical protein
MDADECEIGLPPYSRSIGPDLLGSAEPSICWLRIPVGARHLLSARPDFPTDIGKPRAHSKPSERMDQCRAVYVQDRLRREQDSQFNYFI